MDTIEQDVSQMNDIFNGIASEIDATPEPEQEPEPVVEEAVIEPESEPEPVLDAEPEPTAEPEVVEPTDDKDKIIEELRAQVAKLTAKEPEPLPEPEPQTQVLPDEPIADFDFIGDLDMGELYDSPKKFNNLLNSIYKKAVTDTRKSLAEGVLRTIPDIVKANIVTVTGMQKASQDFYEKNADLEPFKKVVAVVFEEMASSNPGKSYKEVIKLVAPEVRKRLGLQRKALEKAGAKPPNLPRPGGRQARAATKPDLDPLQNELEAMNNSLR